ncbi:MAG: trimeric intracellular cation channel family protein [Sphingobacteriia bacterium]|nr:trimeric intracellular cation channel family protein [Sphingobacteriia bacterium]NCC39204.1 trimeric intracellular cation channel family protein [Gammaproteobacteria bacterium]
MLILIEVAAIIAFAVSGLIESVRHRMDVVGVFTVAFVAAFGGGTLRDVLLDRRPLFWVQHQEYVWLVMALTLIGPPLLGWMRHRWVDRLMQATDALGLGLFAVSGTALALAAEMPLIVAVLLGVVTGVFGGVLRDLLCNRIPVIFYDHRPYALCAFIGCWVFVGLDWLGLEDWQALMAGVGAATGSRLLAVGLDWRIPPWPRESSVD